MNEFRQRYLKALRSGEYEQIHGHFFKGHPHTTKKLCALGLAYRLSEYKEQSLGLTSDDQSLVVRLNDQWRLTFPQIADYLEEHWTRREGLDNES